MAPQKAWSGKAENIAAGQGSPQQVVAGWLASPEHCANVMNGRFTGFSTHDRRWAKKLVEKYFGPIPAGAPVPPVNVRTPPPRGCATGVC